MVTPSSKFTGTHVPMKRVAARAKCLAQEHNAVPRPRLKPRSLDLESTTLTIRPTRSKCQGNNNVCPFYSTFYPPKISPSALPTMPPITFLPPVIPQYNVNNKCRFGFCSFCCLYNFQTNKPALFYKNVLVLVSTFYQFTQCIFDRMNLGLHIKILNITSHP